MLLTKNENSSPKEWISSLRKSDAIKKESKLMCEMDWIKFGFVYEEKTKALDLVWLEMNP